MGSTEVSKAGRTGFKQMGIYTFRWGIERDIWLMSHCKTERVALKSQNSFKKCQQSKVLVIFASWRRSPWAAPQCGRVWRLPQPGAHRLRGPRGRRGLGGGRSEAGGGTSVQPPASEKWLIHGMFLGPLRYTLLVWHQNARGFAVCILLSPHFGGQIPRTLFKPYSDELRIESVETFSEQRLNKEVEEGIAKGTDGLGDVIDLFHLTL